MRKYMQELKARGASCPPANRILAAIVKILIRTAALLPGAVLSAQPAGSLPSGGVDSALIAQHDVAAQVRPATAMLRRDDRLPTAVLPSRAPANRQDRDAYRSRGFYDTEERIGLGLRIEQNLTALEFSWARLPVRRLSLGIWADVAWIEPEPDPVYGAGGGLSMLVFPVLPSARRAWGLYAGGHAGGMQRFDRRYAKMGGEGRLFAEAGWFGHLGRRSFLIPRLGVRETRRVFLREMREVDRETLRQALLGLEMRLGKTLPGVVVLTGEGKNEFEIFLRFAW